MTSDSMTPIVYQKPGKKIKFLLTNMGFNTDFPNDTGPVSYKCVTHISKAIVPSPGILHNTIYPRWCLLVQLKKWLVLLGIWNDLH